MISSGELTLQEQINLQQKQIDALKKRLDLISNAPARRAPAQKRSPLTPDEEGQAELQITPILRDLPGGKMVSARYISQQKAVLRRLGTTKIREYLEQRVEWGIFRKEGTGKSAQYCMKIK